jgi:hypothetical protein
MSPTTLHDTAPRAITSPDGVEHAAFLTAAAPAIVRAIQTMTTVTLVSEDPAG